MVLVTGHCPSDLPGPGRAYHSEEPSGGTSAATATSPRDGSESGTYPVNVPQGRNGVGVWGWEIEGERRETTERWAFRY